MQVERYERIMATRVGAHMLAEPGAEDAAGDKLAACMDWFREVERRLTRFNMTSELSRLNAAAGSWRAVSPLLFDALAEGVRAAQASDGLFDPTLLAVLEALGYDRDYGALSRQRVASGVAPGGRALWVGAAPGGWRAIDLDAASRRVRLPYGVRIDLGGIAKGWAADVALERFFAPEDHALLDVGGDMRARGGPEEGDVWPIALGASEQALSADPDALPVVTLGAGGLAVSGARDRWWYHDGARQHHLIDPRTGRPAHLWIDAGDDDTAGEPLLMAAAAFAPTAAHAEVAAKVAILRGYPLALRVVEEAWARAATTDTLTDEYYGDTPVALLLTLSDGRLVPSANLDDYLTTHGGGGTTWLT
ncbi:MAG TPA: FAD:protein FMN transferase [Ktedonobacterales bacterium]